MINLNETNVSASAFTVPCTTRVCPGSSDEPSLEIYGTGTATSPGCALINKFRNYLVE